MVAPMSATNISESIKIGEFLDLVAEMFSRSDYLLPLAAGQRQFRQDNYQMASASQLEDLFFDAFGMYLRENHPRLSLRRRSGSEVWDYEFDGLELSHKETLSRGVSVWWTAGERTQSGQYVPVPDKRAYTSPCPIVLVHSGMEPVTYSTSVAGAAREGKLRGALGGKAIREAKPSLGKHSVVHARWEDPSRLVVEQVIDADTWAGLGFFDLWPVLGGTDLQSRDLWLDQRFSDRSRGLADVQRLAEGVVLHLDDHYLPAGIYVLSTEQLTDAPMVANNRAHSVEPEFLAAAMRESLRAGTYRPFPLWFAWFASAPPPNLYVRQRGQYEELFAARQRADI